MSRSASPRRIVVDTVGQGLYATPRWELTA